MARRIIYPEGETKTPKEVISMAVKVVKESSDRLDENRKVARAIIANVNSFKGKKKELPDIVAGLIEYRIQEVLKEIEGTDENKLKLYRESLDK